jgi:hypothetical protein
MLGSIRMSSTTGRPCARSAERRGGIDVTRSGDRRGGYAHRSGHGGDVDVGHVPEVGGADELHHAVVDHVVAPVVEHGVHDAQPLAWVRPREEPYAPWWKAGSDYRLGTEAPALLKVLMRDTVSPVFNLDRARRLERLTPGANVAMHGQGSGFTRAGAILAVC